MTNRHFTRRAPRGHMGFSWGRFPADGGASVTYRLFRRDHVRRTHVRSLQFFPDTPRPVIAMNLLRARRELREFVDGLQFADWGIAA